MCVYECIYGVLCACVVCVFMTITLIMKAVGHLVLGKEFFFPEKEKYFSPKVR